MRCHVTAWWSTRGIKVFGLAPTSHCWRSPSIPLIVNAHFAGLMSQPSFPVSAQEQEGDQLRSPSFSSLELDEVEVYGTCAYASKKISR